MKRREGFFSISAVAQMFSVHQQTIRLYEKEGLITPRRSAGNTRLFSEADIRQLEEIIYLTHNVGINLAGVDMILKLQTQIKKLQDEMNSLFVHAQHELEREAEIRQRTIQDSAQKLASLKKEKRVNTIRETEDVEK